MKLLLLLADTPRYIEVLLGTEIGRDDKIKNIYACMRTYMQTHIQERTKLYEVIYA
jgi:hypothetical protein